jgi:hypothetical protein
MSDQRWSRRLLVVLAVLAVTSTVAFVIAVPDAFAAGNDVGRNAGALLKQWAVEIYGGIVALFGLPFLVNRQYTGLTMFLLAAVVVAWLVFSPDQIAHAARGIGNQVLGG